MSDYPERRSHEDSRYTRQSMFEMVADIQKKTSETHVALFGPPGQAEMGFVHQTNTRLAVVEKKMWAAAGGVISALLGTAWAALRK